MTRLSLLDTADLEQVDWFVVYQNRAQDHWWTRYLEPGFQHCWLAKPTQYGPNLTDILWTRVDPCLPFVHVDTFFEPTPPWIHDHGMTVQRVTSFRPARVRDWFSLGPPSCVEIAKACLGVNAFWVRTPWQLYKHIRERSCVLLTR